MKPYINQSVKIIPKNMHKKIGTNIIDITYLSEDKRYVIECVIEGYRVYDLNIQKEDPTDMYVGRINILPQSKEHLELLLSY